MASKKREEEAAAVEKPEFYAIEELSELDRRQFSALCRYECRTWNEQVTFLIFQALREWEKKWEKK